MQKFLRAVCDHPVLRKSPAVVAFLKSETQDKYNQARPAIDSQVPSYVFLTSNFSFEPFQNFKLDSLKTPTGEAKSRVSKNVHRYSVETERMLKSSEASYSRLKTLSLELISNLEKTGTTLAQITEEVKNLEEINAAYNTNVPEGKWTELGKVFTDMRGSLEQWHQQTVNNANLTREQLFKSFKYARKECEAGLEVLRTRNIAGQGYFAAVESINDQKEKLLASKDPSKWDLDFSASKFKPNELLNNREVVKHLMLSSKKETVNKMRSVLGYFNDLMVSELSTLGRTQALRLARGLGNWSTERVEIIDSEKRSLEALQAKLRQVIPQLSTKSESVSAAQAVEQPAD